MIDALGDAPEADRLVGALPGKALDIGKWRLCEEAYRKETNKVQTINTYCLFIDGYTHSSTAGLPGEQQYYCNKRIRERSEKMCVPLKRRLLILRRDAFLHGARRLGFLSNEKHRTSLVYDTAVVAGSLGMHFFPAGTQRPRTRIRGPSQCARHGA